MFSAYIVNSYTACSTIIIGGFGSDIRERVNILNDFKNLPPEYGNEATLGTYDPCDHCSRDREGNRIPCCRDCGNGRSPRMLKEFAFITASLSDDQTIARKLLNEIGFSESKKSFNMKNATNVYFFVISMKDYVEWWEKTFSSSKSDSTSNKESK